MHVNSYDLILVALYSIIRLDGVRCGETLKSIFENAKDPSRVYVGLVEQNAPDDKFCLEEYCNSFGTCVRFCCV